MLLYKIFLLKSIFFKEYLKKVVLSVHLYVQYFFILYFRPHLDLLSLLAFSLFVLKFSHHVSPLFDSPSHGLRAENHMLFCFASFLCSVKLHTSCASEMANVYVYNS